MYVLLVGCSGRQSALEPLGQEAEAVSHLFWVMAAGGGFIWLGVVVLLLAALHGRLQHVEARSAGRLILWCGAVFPAVVLIVLLTFALWLMPGLRPFANKTDTRITIEVTGRQFWWDVVYRLPDRQTVRTANEIVLPVGERVELSLRSTDVIHSFWIPSLAGKVDMIPGRTNRLSLLATKTGRIRGPCAEYCGTSHALMAFDVSILPAEDFDEWVRHRTAQSPGTSEPGGELFQKHGCGGCHRVSGTLASSEIGPDLTHLGSRATIGAGILPNTQESIARFIARPDDIKPGVHMPAFEMLPPEDVRTIAGWLKGLE